MHAQEVTCGDCGHPAMLSAASDVWKCNCHAGVGPDPDCRCDAVNHEPGAEDNATDPATSEIAELEARLLTLRGEVTPIGSHEMELGGEG